MENDFVGLIILQSWEENHDILLIKNKQVLKVAQELGTSITGGAKLFTHQYQLIVPSQT